MGLNNVGGAAPPVDWFTVKSFHFLIVYYLQNY